MQYKNIIYLIIYMYYIIIILYFMGVVHFRTNVQNLNMTKPHTYFKIQDISSHHINLVVNY